MFFQWFLYSDFLLVIFWGVRVGCARSDTGFVIPSPNSVYKHYTSYQNFENLYIKGVLVV